jgi:kynureninase
MEELRDKSVLLTAYLEYLLLHYYPANNNGTPSVRIITPTHPRQRGAQLSVMFSVPVEKVYAELKKRGCVVRRSAM